MLGFLKKFVSRGDNGAATAIRPAPPARPVAPARPAVRPAQTARPAAPAARPASPVRPAGTPPAVPSSHASHYPSRISRPVVHSPDADFVEPVQTAVPVTGFVDVPFKPLFAKLPPEIQSKPHNSPEGDDFLFQLPLSIVCEQLPTGAIRLSLSDFRRFSPSGVFPSEIDGDETEVNLPLSVIIPCLKPGQLPRRSDQRRIEVPEDIAPLFGPDGRPVKGLKVAAEKPKASDSFAAKPHAPSAPAAAVRVIPVAPVAPSTAALPKPAPAPMQSLPFTPSPFEAIPAAVVAPVPTPAPISPIAPAPPIALSHEPIRAPQIDPGLATLKPKVAPSPLPQPAAAAPQVASQVAPQPQSSSPKGGTTTFTRKDVSTETFHISLMDFSAHWTSAGKQELANLYKHGLQMPMDRVEAGLKRGKLVFQWRELRPWIKLASGNALPPIADDYEVDLPLHIVAPRYLQEKTPIKSAKRALPGDDIPDVFDIKPSDIAANEAASAAPAAAPVPDPVVPQAIVAPPAAAEVALESHVPNRLFEYGEIFGQPDKKSWTLGEVAQRC